MKIVPYLIPYGIKIRRWQTKTKAGKVFRPGDIVYLITNGVDVAQVAFSTHIIAWHYLRALNNSVSSFKPQIPRRAI